MDPKIYLNGIAGVPFTYGFRGEPQVPFVTWSGSEWTSKYRHCGEIEWVAWRVEPGASKWGGLTGRIHWSFNTGVWEPGISVMYYKIEVGARVGYFWFTFGRRVSWREKQTHNVGSCLVSINFSSRCRSITLPLHKLYHNKNSTLAWGIYFVIIANVVEFNLY